MNKKSAEKLNEMTRVAAFRIVKALKAFGDQPKEIQQQAEQIVMGRIHSMRNGNDSIIEGDDLIKEIPEAAEVP